MKEQLLLEILVLLLAILLALLGYIFRQHGTLHKELQQELTEISRQRIACLKDFATKGAMTRAHCRIDEQQAEIGELSTRVTRLEPKGCAGRV